MQPRTTPLLRRALATAVAAGVTLMAACAGDDPSAVSLAGSEVEVSGTFQSPAPVPDGTGGDELPFEVLVGAEPGQLTVTRTVGAGVEFPRYLGYWNIDVQDDRLVFESTGVEPFPGAFAALAPDSFMRITFAGLEGVGSIDSSAPRLEAAVDDDAVTIVLGPGFELGQERFVIELGGA